MNRLLIEVTLRLQGAMRLLKRVPLLVVVWSLVFSLWSLVFAQRYPLAYYPTYAITGTVNDAPDGKSANGYKVYFYHTTSEYNAGFYSSDTIGPSGITRVSNRFMINAYSLGISHIIVGETYYVGIPNDNPDNPSQGYGADPVAVTISGRGIDEISVALTLTKGGGATLPQPPPPVVSREPAPSIKVWFGNRLYQPAIYGTKEEGKKPFIISEKGKIKLEVNIPDPYLLDEAKSYTVKIQSPAGEIKTYDVSTMAGVKASSAGIKPFIIETDYPEVLKAEAEENTYVFTFQAASRGTVGLSTTVTTTCAVTVLGGPLRIIGVPITFPSPFSITKHGKVTIQYELSKDANISLYLISPTGDIIKRWIFNAGEEGGSAGVNKVVWDGKTDQGYLAGNAIYLGSIISRDDNRLLAKYKLTIVD